MSGQIKFFKKSHIDVDNINPELTVTDAVATSTGQDFLKFTRNRNNNSGWNTTGSSDAANTEILIDLKDFQVVDFFMIIRHNFKSFKVEWLNVNTSLFEEYITVVDNALTTNILEKSVYTNQLKLTIMETVVPNDDKSIRQIIVTEKFFAGELEGWPEIKKPKSSLNKKITKMVSGKIRIVETRGSYSCSLQVKLLKIDEDLKLIENIYFNREGVLMLISGAKEDQFSSLRVGYRNEDIVLVSPVNELELPFVKNYTTGIKINMKMAEVVR